MAYLTDIFDRPYLSGAVEQTPRTELFLDWWSKETIFAAGNINKPENYTEMETDGAMIVWPYKWIHGFQLGMAFWTSENHPNNTDPWNTCKHPPPGGRQPQECPPPGYVDGWPFIACYPEPCLFNIEEDPTEHVNLLEGGGTPQHRMIAASIKARIDDELDVVDGRSRGFFQSNDIGPVKGCKPPAEVVAAQHGFFGPFCE